MAQHRSLDLEFTVHIRFFIYVIIYNIYIYYIIVMIHIIHMAVADQEICVCVVFCVPKNSTISPPFLSRLSQAALPPDRYLGHPEGASDL